MLLTMAKKKKPGRKPAGGDGAPKRGPREGRAYSLYLDDDIALGLQQYVESMEYPPSWKDVIQKGLKRILAENGYFPPRAPNEEG